MKNDIETSEQNETELMELGEVSTDTHGTFIGHAFDGGFGVRPPAA